MGVVRNAMMVVEQDAKKGVRWLFLAFGIVVSVLSFFVDWWWVAGFGAVAILWSIRDYLQEVWDKVHARYGSVEAPTSKLVGKYAGRYGTSEGWVNIGQRELRTGAITSPELNRKLASDGRIDIDNAPEWHVADWLEEQRVRMFHLLDSDDIKIRLASDLTATSPSVTVQPVRYSAFLVTNRLAYETIRDHGHQRLGFRDVGVVDDQIPDLAHSNCSNHLGGDILAVGDGFFWLQWQGGHNVQSKDTYAASGSGSFDWAQDRPGLGELVPLVKAGMLRELREEMGLRRQDVPSQADTRVIGYARTNGLGGKPAFYGVCRIDDVKTRIVRRERPYVSELFKIEFDATRRESGLLDSLDEHIADYPRSSVPLILLVEVMHQWLAEPDAVRWLFG
jgi:hypothetical protein